MKFPILLPNIFNHPFTYESDLKLKTGDFVEVPFGKSKIIGVVWDNFEKNSYKTFKIRKIIRKLQIPNLKKKTLEFLNWFSEYNLVPKGMALKLVLLSGKPVEKLDKKFNSNSDNEIKKNSFKLTNEQKKSLNEIKKSNEPVYLNNKTKTKTLLACTEKDYESAILDVIPDRWYNAIKRLH